MDTLPPVAPGFVRISIALPRQAQITPGDLAQASGLDPQDLGPAAVEHRAASIDVRSEMGRAARERLDKIGPTSLIGWEWQWLRLAVGRNHGLTIGQFRKIMVGVDALPLGRIAINNTHSMVGIQDFRLTAVAQRLSTLRINGFAARPEILPPGTGPGSPAYTP